MTHTQQSARQTKGQEGPVQICKFEELKGEFIVKREIGRGESNLKMVFQHINFRLHRLVWSCFQGDKE